MSGTGLIKNTISFPDFSHPRTLGARSARSFLKMLFLITGNKQQQQKHYNTLPQILFLTDSIFLFLEVHDIDCEVFMG